MHKLAALALLALTTSATPTPALPTKITSADLLQAATELAQKYDTNYAAKNPAGMADLYTPDAVLIPTTGQVLHGRDAIRNFYTSRFANGAGNHQIRVVEVHVQGNGGYGLARFNARNQAFRKRQSSPHTRQHSSSRSDSRQATTSRIQKLGGKNGTRLRWRAHRQTSRKRFGFRVAHR